MVLLYSRIKHLPHSLHNQRHQILLLQTKISLRFVFLTKTIQIIFDLLVINRLVGKKILLYGHIVFEPSLQIVFQMNKPEEFIRAIE